MENRTIFLDAVEQVLSPAIVALACREQGKCKLEKCYFGLAIAGNDSTMLDDLFTIIQHVFKNAPMVGTNRLLRVNDPLDWLGENSGLRNVVRQSGYSNIIVSQYCGGEGREYALLALDVCVDRQQDIAHVELVERNFKNVATEIIMQPDGHGAASPAEKLSSPLTAREHEVLAWLRIGKSNWAIGKLIGISEHSVKHTVSIILKKYGVASRYHLLKGSGNSPAFPIHQVKNF